MDRKENITPNTLEIQKNDEIEGTFCYELFENSFFDEKLCQELIAELPNINRTVSSTQIIKWIISSVDTCFTSHHDDNDLYQIKNYSKKIEAKWKEYRQILEKYT